VSDTVRIEIHGEVAVLKIDNPPVNPLSASVRAGLLAGIKSLEQNDAIKAVVIACAGRTFISGADIREFDKPMSGNGLVEIFDHFERSKKPIIAAIHGVAFGGGLEVSMACHFRIAAKDAKLGQPEVNLGLIPGGGGTQRLPRAIGPERAVQMIVTGAPIGADEALKLTLIDEIFEGDATIAGVEFAGKVIAENRPLKRLRDDESKLKAARANRRLFTDAAAAVLKKNRGLKAPQACVEAVSWSLNVPFDEAIRKEWRLFLNLMQGDQARAQRHVFFAERDTGKVPGVSPETKPRNVSSVAIIGAGTMGGGIAMSFANAGIPVTLIEVGAEALERGLTTIRNIYRATAARGGLAPEQLTKRLDLIEGVVGTEHVKDADLIVEAVFETMDIKKSVFAALDQHAKPGAILATNTSYLDVNVIAEFTKRPQDVVGMHFFSPANIMKLCEVVRGAKTTPDVLATATSLARKIGKIPVVVGVCHGFVGNRMLEVRAQQADRLLYLGASPQQVDAVLTKFGMPMGLFAMGDMAGLDIGWRSRKDQGITSAIPDALCEQGRFGLKAGKGYYRYEEGSRTPLPDPEVDALIANICREKKIERRPVSDEEIFDRMMFPMINEGARIIEERIASRASDIDIIWIYGYGWPIQTGGPMHFGETYGLARVAERLAYLAGIDKDRSLYPAPLLEKLAFSGDSFDSILKPAAK
jgi:3-hydroxyacyl-CoA dehydrogenase